ncbi:MAG TPA: MFS transporter [Verrucomicrobiota bacterium]|nr:MFS transporter [Verrucomicrobiota bacterium]HNU50080.1 MFS transporter [Verrucomicrobiota bacterium]
MLSRRIKNGSFVLEGLNAFATTLFFTYLFFHMRDRFGFTNLGNLLLCAVSGLVYCIAVWFGGKFAQRHGYFFALRLGFSIMAGALLLGSLAANVPTTYAILILWTIGMSLTWPVLEAIVSEHETPDRLKRMLGIYNIVWAGAGGLATFAGGAILERLGQTGIFLLPAALHLAQLLLLAGLNQPANGSQSKADPAPPPATTGLSSDQERRRSSLPPERFLTLAWIANPFAYIAMNALIPVIPKIAERFALGPMLAGFFCSVWLFARAGSFLALWLWDGWHYRFRWLLFAYFGMAAFFMIILLGKSLVLLVAAQVVFGAAVGLIYYSSLYYSMDLGETKGEHGGFHESAIGAGICAGPAVGALSLRFFPQIPNMHAWAVGALLVIGLAWIIALRYRSNPSSR